MIRAERNVFIMRLLCENHRRKCVGESSSHLYLLASKKGDQTCTFRDFAPLVLLFISFLKDNSTERILKVELSFINITVVLVNVNNRGVCRPSPVFLINLRAQRATI